MPDDAREPRTLLAVFAHPDDEMGALGTMLAQAERGDRIHLAWLTDGEKTEAMGGLSEEEVGRRRREHARGAAEMLGAEPHFFGMPDTAVEATPEAARRVADLIARVRPDGLLTFGDAWARGLRHPDHQATGKIARDAITLARVAKVVAPAEPHRSWCPVFTYRGHLGRLPTVAVDVEPYRERIHEIGRHYQERVGFGDPEWVDRWLRSAGERWADVTYAEEWEAWESKAGKVVEALLPAEYEGPPIPS